MSEYNILKYRTTDNNGLSFELLVDEQALGLLVGARDSAIPYWLWKGWPIDGLGNAIVAICGCGEEGCGSTTCKIDVSEHKVDFSEFDGDVSRQGRSLKFSFKRENYDAVLSEIVAKANAYADRIGTRYGKDWVVHFARVRSKDATHVGRASAEYLIAGQAAEKTTAELLDYLGVSSPSILELAGYSDEEAQIVMDLIAKLSDDDINRYR